MILIIALPFVALSIILAGIVFLCHLRHKRRMDALHHQEKRLLGDGELHAHEVGDNTLRVRLSLLDICDANAMTKFGRQTFWPGPECEK